MARMIVIGGGGHGKVVAELAGLAGHSVIGFVDGGQPAGARILGLPVLGDEQLLEDGAFLREHAFVVAIGAQATRRRLALSLLERGAALASLVHPRAVLAPSARLGCGSVVAAAAVVGTEARIGRFCIVNSNATVDHETALADGVQVCPGANLAGGVRCAADAFIGTGAAVLPSVRIGARAVVGAGAVVLRDVPAEAVAVGNPARLRPSGRRPLVA